MICYWKLATKRKTQRRDTIWIIKDRNDVTLSGGSYSLIKKYYEIKWDTDFSKLSCFVIRKRSNCVTYFLSLITYFLSTSQDFQGKKTTSLCHFAIYGFKFVGTHLGSLEYCKVAPFSTGEYSTMNNHSNKSKVYCLSYRDWLSLILHKIWGEISSKFQTCTNMYISGRYGILNKTDSLWLEHNGFIQFIFNKTISRERR